MAVMDAQPAATSPTGVIGRLRNLFGDLAAGAILAGAVVRHWAGGGAWWLLDNAPVNDRWCLIHATHMTEDETRRMAKSGAIARTRPRHASTISRAVAGGRGAAAVLGGVASGPAAPAPVLVAACEVSSACESMSATITLFASASLWLKSLR